MRPDAVTETATVETLTARVEHLEREKAFILNWLSDLLGAAEDTLEPEARVKLFEGTGRGCFRRHSFKADIARDGAGDVEALIEAYRRNFEIWRENDLVHIRYGAVSSGCYCPVAKGRAPQPNDMHCECTRMTHQSVFETALQRPFKVEILESVRRGGQTCHFVVHLEA